MLFSSYGFIFLFAPIAIYAYLMIGNFTGGGGSC